jgi:hypothetical protein
METLGLHGPERKNFVPVDWVSAVMTHILGLPSHHGKTYHLTTPLPMRIAQMTAVVQAAVETYSTPADAADQERCDGAWFADAFRQQMDVYRAYWRDDPDFDISNTLAAAPHLPCPMVDDDMLMLMAKYAILSNFGKPRPRPVRPDFDVQRHLQPLLHLHEKAGPNGAESPCLGLQVNGPGGGQWKLLLASRRLAAAERGISGHCTAVFHLTSKTFHRLAAQRLTVAQALREGRVRIEGNGLAPHELESILQAAVTTAGAHSAAGPCSIA